jgi:hypothetical protein
MNDIDWKRLEAAVGIAVVLELVALGVCLLTGIHDPYRAMINTTIGIVAVSGVYATRKRINRGGAPIKR